MRGALVALVLPVAAAAAPAEAVYAFEPFLSALTEGQRARIVVRFEQCLRDSEPGPDAVIGFEVTAFEAVAKGAVGNPAGFVAASSERWIADPARGALVSTTWVKVYDDLRADVVVRTLDPKTRKPLEVSTYGCAVGANSGVTLFVDPG